MSDSIKLALKHLLKGVSWLFFVAGGLAFWFGGRAISEFAKTDRMLGEFEGIGLAIGCAALGFMAKAAGERIGEDGGPTRLNITGE